MTEINTECTEKKRENSLQFQQGVPIWAASSHGIPMKKAGTALAMDHGLIIGGNGWTVRHRMIWNAISERGTR